MLRLGSEDLWVDMSGFESMDAMSGVIEVQTSMRYDDRAYRSKCLDGVLKLRYPNEFLRASIT